MGAALTIPLQTSCLFEAGPHFTSQASLERRVVQASLKLNIFLPQPPSC